MHSRRVFLEALRTQLKTLPGFGGVWIQRIGPVRNMFPCLTLYSESETVETSGMSFNNREQERTLNISVSAWVRGTPDDEKAESDMDNAATAIESTLTRPTGTNDMTLVATDFKVSEDEPEIHVVTLTYQLKFCNHSGL